MVRTALHVQPASVIGEWTMCTSKIHYTSNLATVLPIYEILIANYRGRVPCDVILVYPAPAHCPRCLP